jgi:alanine-glyoxylate transaminase/serine-glyoxylate transaminase/serine-pyruvate transaminase
VSPRWYSDTVTAVRLPAGVDGAAVCRIAYHRYRTSFGGGLGQVAGRVFRIGHLGDVNEVSCLSALAAAEMALLDAGVELTTGSGVAAAQAYFRQALADEETVPGPWASAAAGTRLAAAR